MIIDRRRFLTGLIAAPVIVRAGLLMPVKAIEPVIISGRGLFDAVDIGRRPDYTTVIWCRWMTRDEAVAMFGSTEFDNPIEIISIEQNPPLIPLFTGNRHEKLPVPQEGPGHQDH